MREILFRGKSEYNGEWIFGSLHIEYGETDRNGNRNIDYRIMGMRGECDYIIPETAGQFTGLTDKNGKKIFEGDIVRSERICNGNIWTGCVVWWHGCFAIQGLKDGNNVPAIDLFRNYEVIGNIHDNP